MCFCCILLYFAWPKWDQHNFNRLSWPQSVSVYSVSGHDGWGVFGGDKTWLLECVRSGRRGSQSHSRFVMNTPQIAAQRFCWVSRHTQQKLWLLHSFHVCHPYVIPSIRRLSAGANQLPQQPEEEITASADPPEKSSFLLQEILHLFPFLCFSKKKKLLLFKQIGCLFGILWPRLY